MARFDARTEAARAKSGASLAAEYEGQTRPSEATFEGEPW